MKILLKQLLVPTDFSKQSDVALTHAVALAEQFDASLHLLHVVESVVAAETLPSNVGLQHDLDEVVVSTAWDELHRLLSPEDRRRLHTEVALEWGSPFVEIVRYAESHAIDLIAMGTHGRGGVKHLLLGSVAEHVVRSSPCPVLTVRDSAREFVRP